MKNKQGFTLAEVLITLGIIGVVAALTAPALVKNTANAQVGPTLAKVKSTVEVANEQLMHEQGINDLYKLDNDITPNLVAINHTANGTGPYPEILTQYISGSSIRGAVEDDTFVPAITNYDGSEAGMKSYSQVFNFSDSITLLLTKRQGVRDAFGVGHFIPGSDNVMQIEGGEASGSADSVSYNAKGSFRGAYYEMLVDINGAKTGPNSYGKDIFVFAIDRGGKVVPVGSQTFDWLKGGSSDYESGEDTYKCNADEVGTGYGCAGSVMDNNLKVIYQ